MSASVHSATEKFVMVRRSDSGDGSLENLSYLACAMAPRVRHCVECPKCRMRYLLSCSPYRNGSFLMPLVEGVADEWTLYCSCGRPHVRSYWNWSELKRYAIPNQAHERGYGSPDEIVPVNDMSRIST